MYAQISLEQSLRNGRLATPDEADGETRRVEEQAMQSSLLGLSRTWPHDSHEQVCPYPIVMNRSQLDRVETIHMLLDRAITNIIERWWADHEARFPERMPLEQYEENTLRWMDARSPEMIPLYRNSKGSWRPDFLIEYSQSGDEYRICEINARFLFNGYLHTAFGQQAHIHVDRQTDPLTQPVVNPQAIFEGLLSLFDPSLPLHLLKGEEWGIDIHLFIPFFHSITGRKPILIGTCDLRLCPCNLSSTGFTLKWVAGIDAHGEEILESVYQIGLELHQRELRALPAAVLREISLRCCNDLRTIFLVHDKRMLGIILQELDNLVKVHKILTCAQAETLRRAITPTINPGSRALTVLADLSRIWPELKNDFLLKPIRSGKGDGILFGSNLEPRQWSALLDRLRTPDLKDGDLKYVVQRRIQQPRFNILLSANAKFQRSYLVGTFMTINGSYLGLGIWRTSLNPICALSQGGAWINSVVPAAEATGM